MSDPGRRGVRTTRGKHVRSSLRGQMRWARASTGRCFLSTGEVTSVHQSGEVDGGEAFRKVPQRVRGPKSGEGGEGWQESTNS